MKNSKKMLAWMLAAAMLFTNVDYVGATAVETSDVVVEDVSGGSVSGSDASEGDVPTNDGDDVSTNDGDDVSAGEVSGNDVSKGDADILFSGELESGVVWQITSDEVLYITGEETEEMETLSASPWITYKSYFTKCIVDATHLTNMSYWFAECDNLVELDMSQVDGKYLEDFDHTLDNCTNLLVFKTMYNKILNTDVILPHVMINSRKEQVSRVWSSYESEEYRKPRYYGKANGFRWQIMYDEVLYIIGEEFNKGGDRPWCAYKDYFTKVDLENSGGVCGNIFEGCDNITEATVNIKHAHTGCYLKKLFYGCSSLNKVNVIEFDNFDSDCESLFEGCYNLVSIEGETFSLGIHNATNMFKGCKKLETLDLSGITIDDSTIMDGMFSGCSSLREIDFSGFKSSGSSAINMLEGCDSLYAVKNFKNLNIDVVLPHEMYDGAGNVYVNLPRNIDSDMWLYKYFSCSGEMDSLKWWITEKDELYISGEDIGSDAIVRQEYPWHNYKEMYTNAIILVRNVKSTAYWFDGCDNIEQVDMSEFDASNLVSMKCMFRGCSNLHTITKMGSTENVTDFSSMFENCSSLESVPRIFADNAIDLSNMFKGCTKFTSAYRIENVSKAINLSGMYEGCSSLRSSNIDHMGTQNVTDMSNMFKDCSSLNWVILYQNDLSSVMDMSNMFNGCIGIKNMSLSSSTLPEGVNVEGFLTGCTGLEEITIPANLGVDIKVPKEMFDFAGTSYKDYFPKDLEVAERLYAVSPAVKGELRFTSIPDQFYTGKPIKPEIKVYEGTYELIKNVDYTVSYANNINARYDFQKNPPTIIFRGKGNYSGTKKLYFTIEDVSILDAEIEQLFLKPDGKRHLPNPTVTYKGKKLVKNKDYRIYYTDMEDDPYGAYRLPGGYGYEVVGIGNFSDVATEMQLITNEPIMKDAKVDAIPKQSYTGEPIEPVLNVTYKGKTLVEGKDYLLTYENNIEVGKAAAILEGLGDFWGPKEVAFQIVGQSITKAEVTGIENKVYSGKAQNQEISVKLNGAPLVAGKDYVVEYSKNVNVGKATMKIIGKGGYVGTIKKTFKITAYDLAADNLKLINGMPDDLEVSYEKGGSKPQVNLSYAGTKLILNKDFSIKYSNNNKITSAQDKKAPTLTITGKGNFKGTKKYAFSIKQKELQDAENPLYITLPDVPYSKKAGSYVSKLTITDVNGRKLVAGTDYEKNIVYKLADGTQLDKKSVVQAGETIFVTVVGKGRYTGTLKTSYRITEKSFSKAKITIVQQEYTGNPITLSKEDITVKMGKDELEYGVDYEIIEESYKNNLQSGNASVTIRGLGEYGGNKTVKYKIKKFDLAKE